jgi:intein-encoded DNA endonuclease-like protein
MMTGTNGTRRILKHLVLLFKQAFLINTEDNRNSLNLTQCKRKLESKRERESVAV